MTTAADVLAAVEQLAPTIAGRAAEIEEARRLPADLLDELSGRRLPADWPRRATAASAPTSRRDLRVFEALARADASVAWTVMIGGSAWLDLAGLPQSDVRRALRRRTRRHRRRRVQPDRLDRTRSTTGTG